MTYKKTLIINALASPGSGKSTLCGGLFNLLKTNNYDVEYVQEFAKTLTWEKNYLALSHQSYVSGCQMYVQNMLIGQVQAVITDSPILLGLMYYREKNTKIRKAFTDFIIESFKAQNNLNLFIERKKEYNPNGRSQTVEESDEISKHIKKMLKKYDIPYISVEGNNEGLGVAYKLAIQEIS